MSQKICISRGQALEVDNIGSLVTAADTLHFDASSDLYSFSIAGVDELVHFYIQCFGDSRHQLVELFIGNNVFLVIHSAVFRQTCKV